VEVFIRRESIGATDRLSHAKYYLAHSRVRCLADGKYVLGLNRARLSIVARVVGSTGSEQAALGRIYRGGFDGILALLAVPFLVALKLIEECPVNTLGFRLANRALPDAAQRRVDLRLLREMDKVFYVLNVLPRFRKEKGKLFIGRLKEAERAIQRAVDDLDVLHSNADPVAGRTGNRQDIICRSGWSGAHRRFW